MNKSLTTYRYVIRIGPAYVHAGLTDDLEHAKTEALITWPTGQFFQVGEKTPLDEARAWVTRNPFAAKPPACSR